MTSQGPLASVLELKSWADYAMIGISLLVLARAAQYLVSPTRRLPPSPPADPIIGHGRLMSHSDAHKKYAEWTKTLGASSLFMLTQDKYLIRDHYRKGDVLSLKVPGRTTIILNTFAAARELLDKQSAHFSDRPFVRSMHMFVLFTLLFTLTDDYTFFNCFDLRMDSIGWGDATTSLEYGDKLRTQRRMMLKYLNVVSSSSGAGKVQRTQAAMFLKRLLVTPESFRDLVHV